MIGVSFILLVLSWIGAIGWTIVKRYDLATLAMTSAIYFRQLHKDLQRGR